MPKYEFEVENKGEISDGSHTFKELYMHRMILFATLIQLAQKKNGEEVITFKSKLHHDGTMYDDYFIVGIETPEGQFTYHYEMKFWSFFDVMEVGKAPEWDGHQSDDIIRLLSLI